MRNPAVEVSEATGRSYNSQAATFCQQIECRPSSSFSRIASSMLGASSLENSKKPRKPPACNPCKASPSLIGQLSLFHADLLGSSRAVSPPARRRAVPSLCGKGNYVGKFKYLSFQFIPTVQMHNCRDSSRKATKECYCILGTRTADSPFLGVASRTRFRNLCGLSGNNTRIPYPLF
jgi:hypothetical protein